MMIDPFTTPLDKETSLTADLGPIVLAVILIILPADPANGKDFLTQLGFVVAVFLGGAQIVFVPLVVRIWFKAGQQNKANLAIRLVGRRFVVQFFMAWLGIGVFLHLVSFKGTLSEWYLWLLLVVSSFVTIVSFVAYKLGTRSRASSAP